VCQDAGILLHTCADGIDLAKVAVRHSEVSRAPPLEDQALQGSGFGKFVLSSLQSGTRSGTKIGRGLSFRADRGSKATPKIPRAAHLFLSSVLRVASHGAGTGRRAKLGRLANDPRHCRSRPCSDRGGMGEPAWHRRRLTPSHRDVRCCSSNARGALLRVLSVLSDCSRTSFAKPLYPRRNAALKYRLAPGCPSCAVGRLAGGHQAS
jgi:hypothetical protein